MTTTPGPHHSLDLHGAIDLSGLARPAAGAAAPPPATGAVMDVVDEATFAAIVHKSTTVPVVLALWASWSEPSTRLVADLTAVAQEHAGRFLLARLDADANPEITQAVGAQSVPTVLGVLRGQPVPLFAGPASREQIVAVIDKLLEVAAANQVTGRLDVAPGPDGNPQDPAAEPAEPPLPPLHQAAFDAIEAGDLDAAAQAYRTALAENPADRAAKVGAAQVELLRRTQTAPQVAGVEPAEDDVDGQLERADVELVAGQIEASFARLVALVRRTAAADRERARERLVELFLIVGDDDPRVMRARRDLANALY